MSFISDAINAKAEEDLLRRIVADDYHRNYVDPDFSAEEAWDRLVEYRKGGGLLCFNRTSIIRYARLDSDTVEFHCGNRGTPQELAEFLTVFLRELSAHVGVAITHFDNEKIVGLLSLVPVPYTVERVDDGKYRTFRAEFTISGMH